MVQDNIPEAGVSLYFLLFYSSLNIGFLIFQAVDACEDVFYFMLLSVLVQSTLNCLGVWCLHNTGKLYQWFMIEMLRKLLPMFFTALCIASGDGLE